METKSCPECLSDIPVAANICRYCTERIVGVCCQECLALNPEGATKCRWCGTRISTVSATNIDTFEVQANVVATVLTQLRLHPQQAFFTPEKLIIRSYGLLGFTSNDEEILWEKVAGFSHRRGLLWDTISIETRGQTPASIGCLDKPDAERVRQVLQGLEK
ncbi:PH domain-containing protein [Ferrimonas lipolytica]|uniref:YokE-like PH domain-containing protein n=1 Tax=Ferrimonas lipolytica TaxID=2724191 RepID=A0A6H1UAL6_9GAMM|nr:PH domain-containing protein [Ferrimonas lipolytica]QIZ76105.1 hypothetical protein HER31_03890 [Ferrimonas lipolytica]